MTTGDPITPREAFARQVRGERVAFVDARSDDHVTRSGCRIPGALRLAPGAPRRLAGLSRDAVVVVYGEHGRSFEPAAVAEQLDAHGFGEVHVLAGGFTGWSELRFPTEPTSSRPDGVVRPRPQGRPARRVVSLAS